MLGQARRVNISVVFRYQRCARFILNCFVLGAILLFVHRNAPQSGLQLSPTSAETEGGDGDVTLTIPLSRVVEPALPSRAWFSGDPLCAHLLTQFARPGSLPDARLASYPRSGNTWTRYLLEAATGLVTCGPTYDSEAVKRPPVRALPAAPDVVTFRNRSMTTSPELRKAGFIAEHVSPLTRTCIIGKTHAFPPLWRRLEGGDGDSDVKPVDSDASSSPSYPLPAVLLVRDPFRAIIAMRHLNITNSMVSAVDNVTFFGPDWRRYVDDQSRYWFELTDEWADGPRHTLLVSYERLVAETAGELRRMLRFLGVTPVPERLSCTMRHTEGLFHNKQHPVVPNAEVFDAALRRRVWSRIRLLDDTLASRGYQRLPLSSYAFYQESNKMFQ